MEDFKGLGGQMQDERGMPCGETCRELAVLNERVSEVRRIQNEVIMPALAAVQNAVEPMKDIVQNYRGWKSEVSESLGDMKTFITEQRQWAKDDADSKKKIAEVLEQREKTYAEKEAERAKAEEERRKIRNKRFTIIAPFAVVIFTILAQQAWIAGEKGLTILHDVIQLTDQWKHAPLPAKKSFFEQEHITPPTLANNE